MKKTILTFLLLILTWQTQAQVINRGRTSAPPGIGSIAEVKEVKPFEFKKQSLISLSMSDVVLTNITLRYEYFSRDGKVGYQIPFSFNAGGLPDTNDYHTNATGRFLSARNRIFQTGFNLNYYTKGQDKTSTFVGLSFAAGWFNYWRYTYTQVPNPNGSGGFINSFTDEKMIGNNYSFAFHAGVLFNPWETLTFTIKGGLGLRRYGTVFPEYTMPFGLVDFSAGFKF